METAEDEEGATLTEQISPRYMELDSWPPRDVLAAMYEGQLAAVAAVRPALNALAEAVEAAAAVLSRGGRIVYIGAGTSGRIGVQDGTELTPTFDWPPERLLFLMAGGFGALVQSAEGAEDSQQNGAQALREAGLGADDVVIGIAASGTTAYTVGALRAANDAGALTVGIACNPGAPLLEAAQHVILVQTGEEVIAGSTRMKAGTAQKIVLNLFSTALMVKLGRVYRGLMVDMRTSNAKLRHRAEIIVREIAHCSESSAAQCLDEASGDVKLAALLALGADAETATATLAQSGGNLRLAIGALGFANG